MANEHNSTQQELARFKRDTAYFEAHREQLLSEYPDQWVAIFNEQVVAADPDFDCVLDAVQQKGVPVGQVLVQHVTAKDETFILPL